MLSAGRHLSGIERHFNERCEFKPGARYTFPVVVEARSLLGDNPIVQFQEAWFLCGRMWRSISGQVLGCDYLFVPVDPSVTAIVPLVFGHETELPKQIGFFVKARKWFHDQKARLLEHQVGGDLKHLQLYEWEEPLEALTLTRHLSRGRGRDAKVEFLPRLIKFRRGIFLKYDLESDQYVFEVEVLGDDGKVMIGRDVIGLQIVKDNLPKRNH